MKASAFAGVFFIESIFSNSAKYGTVPLENTKRGTIMTRQTGRPADESGRLEKEIRTYDFLDANHVWYERIDHEAAMTMEVCEEIDKAL